MSYNYLTQFDSPNYTTAAQTRSVWGVDRNIQHIDIHWWDDPSKNPTFEGTIATLCNPNRGASAHYVATGTGRRVACLVSPDENSWATNQDNPYSISIECDPRCRDEDYDVVAELIANIRSAYGDLSLHPHREFVSTTCPGNWDLARLDALARTKDGSGDWGVVVDKNPPKPAVAKVTLEEADALYKELLGRTIDASGQASYVGKITKDELRAVLLGSQERSVYLNALKAEQDKAAAAAAAAEAKKKADEAQRIADDQAKAAQAEAKRLADEQAKLAASAKVPQITKFNFFQWLFNLIAQLIKGAK